MVNPMADFGALRTILKKAQNIVVLTGAGISAESGIPTFRGSGGFWRNYQSQDLATVGAFKRSPTLVWEFYHYRRELVLTKQPNAAHIALAKTEDLLSREGRKLTIITQNIDGLHQRAGSKDVVELHGSLFKTLCMKCSDISVNTDSPICPSLLGKGAPDAATKSADISEEELPRCKKDGCGGLLRPYVVWFGENLHPDTLEKADSALSDCEACLVVGTSSVVYPAAMYAPQLASRNIPVAEFNIEVTPATDQFMFHFHGPSSETIPKALEDITCSKFERSSADRTIEQPKPAKESLESMRLMTKSLGSVEEPSEAPKSAKDSVEPPKEEGGTSILTGAQKLKQAVRDYGSTVIVFHVGMSLMSLGGFYLAFSSGVDMSWLIEKVGLGNSSLVTGASTFVLAYAVHKVFAPVRISITLGATPFIVRYLRSVGILKPPK